MMLEKQNIVILDLETEYSADSLPTGWNDKVALGLSIGCWYSYEDSRFYWFDKFTLEATMRLFVERQPLLVSFNGIQFYFKLMRALLREKGERGADQEAATETDFSRRLDLHDLCDAFKPLCAPS